MDMKEILDPKKLMIAAGVMVVIISCMGMANSEQWAEWAWDDEPIGEHDAAYEQMWALHASNGSFHNRHRIVCER